MVWKGADEKIVKHAIRDILSNKYNITTSARAHGISRNTLQKYFKKFCVEKNNTLKNFKVSSNEVTQYSANQIFTTLQEITLAGYINTYPLLQNGYTYNKAQKFVFEYGNLYKIKMPRHWFAKKETGLDWFQDFMKRNADYLKDLSERSASIFSTDNMDETDTNSTSQIRLSSQKPFKPRTFITLEERIQIINEYENNPCIPTITELFECSWFQALIIIHGKKEIMKRYAERNKAHYEKRRQKIEFMEVVLYEYILRATYHNIKLDESYIKKKVSQINYCTGLFSWLPTLFWMQQFMKKYKITVWKLENLKELLVPGEEKENCLAIQKIVNHVRCVEIRNKVLKQKNNKKYNTHSATHNLTDDAKLHDLEDTTSSTDSKTPTREEEINFLGRCMFEFIQRRQFLFNDHFDIKMWLQKVRDFNKKLKIDSFIPNNEWLLHFKNTYQISNDQTKLVLNREPAMSSLELEHIIDYCRKNKDIDFTSECAQLPEYEREFHNNANKSKIEILQKPNRKKSETFRIEHTPIDVVDIKEEEMDSLGEVNLVQHENDIETYSSEEVDNNSSEDINPDAHVQEMIWPLDYDVDEEELQSDTNSSNHEAIDIKPDIIELQQTLENDNDVQEPPIKIQCIERFSGDTSTQHRSESYNDFNIEITSNACALKILKPLEDFALLDENYRAIELITQLCDSFRNRQKS